MSFAAVSGVELLCWVGAGAGVDENVLFLVFAFYPEAVLPTYKIDQIKNKEH